MVTIYWVRYIDRGGDHDDGLEWLLTLLWPASHVMWSMNIVLCQCFFLSFFEVRSQRCCTVQMHKCSDLLISCSTFLGNSGLCWTVFARNRDTAVPAEGMATYRRWSVSLWRDPDTLLNPVPWQNWMAAYLGYTLTMKTLFRGWPVIVHDTHTRRRRIIYYVSLNNFTKWKHL